MTAKSLLDLNIENSEEEHMNVPISTRLAVSKIPNSKINGQVSEKEEDPLITLFKVKKLQFYHFFSILKFFIF
jgi:hypothetical protein